MIFLGLPPYSTTQMRYVIDIDGTICDTPADRDYNKSRPFPEAVAEINRLYSKGNYIILFTARGASSGLDWHELTVRQLIDWGIKYNELIDKGKPNGDIFIDDKGLNAEAWRAALKRKSIGIVSGYFNPIHSGHLEYINEAARNCSYLIAIVNSDHQVFLKGSKPFMSESHRADIVKNIRAVDDSMISIDQDKSQCETLKFLRKKYPDSGMSFFNSGDRKSNNLDSSESLTCKRYNILEIVLDLPKIYSSSDLLKT